jgi:phosphoglycerate dehydrogenase-like enzyme
VSNPVIVVEDDPFTRLIGIVLDPRTDQRRVAAFADFMAHDEPDFAGWCSRVQARAASIFPADVCLVGSEEEMFAKLPKCEALVVESFIVGRRHLEAAPKLRVVQKFGFTLRNIDTEACSALGLPILTLRRRANIACAESVFAMMFALARRVPRLSGRISVTQLEEAGFSYRPFDRNHTPGGNYGRVAGMRMLHDTTMGIIGLGEIGREIASRAVAFGMRVLYHQRNRLLEAEERALRADYVPLDDLLAASDFIVPQLPGGDGTRGLLGRTQLAKVRRGAFIVNVANPHVIDRDALVEALRSGQVGGFALDPQYEEPGRPDDELLNFENVILLPHLAGSPRQNGLRDFEELIVGLAKEMSR